MISPTDIGPEELLNSMGSREVTNEHPVNLHQALTAFEPMAGTESSTRIKADANEEITKARNRTLRSAWS